MNKLLNGNHFCIFNELHDLWPTYCEIKLIPLSRWSPGGSPGDTWMTFLSHWRERSRGLPGEFISFYGAFKARPRQSWAEKSENRRKQNLSHSIGIWRMHIHFACFVLWRNNDRPDFTREFNRDAFHAAISPGCTREFNWDDWRVTFPKSLPAFYPGFYPRDLSHCDITRVHPGEICSAWKGYQTVLWYHVPSYQISLKSVKHYWSYRTETIFAYLMSYDLWPIYSKVELGL